MPTIAQQREERAKMDKSARKWAYFTMGSMLTLSTAANVLTAWDHDIVSRVIAGVPPISLFITSALYERMRTNLAIKVGMILAIVVSLAFSWVHIAELAYTHHQHLIISILLPVIIDVPMLFAGTIIINQAQTPPPAIKTALAPKTAPVTKKTVPTKAPATPTKRVKATPKHQLTPATT